MGRPTGQHEFDHLVDAADLAAVTDDAALVVERTCSPHAVASVLLATPDGRVLLARNRQGWGTVGGHVEDDDEALRTAACREVLEEVGLRLAPESLEPLAVVVDRTEFRPGCRHVDFCFVVVVSEPVDVTPASDVSEATWFDLDDCPPVNEHIATHLRALRDRLDRP